jgi:hypothetical protein
MVSTPSNERIRQAQIVESYIQSWGPICPGFDVEEHVVYVCSRSGNPLVAVLDAAEDECNVLCRACADRRDTA